jgi:hypothetical protein
VLGNPVGTQVCLIQFSSLKNDFSGQVAHFLQRESIRTGTALPALTIEHMAVLVGVLFFAAWAVWSHLSILGGLRPEEKLDSNLAHYLWKNRIFWLSGHRGGLIISLKCKPDRLLARLSIPHLV